MRASGSNFNALVKQMKGTCMHSCRSEVQHSELGPVFVRRSATPCLDSIEDFRRVCTKCKRDFLCGD